MGQDRAWRVVRCDRSSYYQNTAAASAKATTGRPFLIARVMFCSPESFHCDAPTVTSPSLSGFSASSIIGPSS